MAASLLKKTRAQGSSTTGLLDVLPFAATFCLLVFIFGPLHLLYINDNLWSEGTSFIFTRGWLPALIVVLALTGFGAFPYVRSSLISLLSGLSIFYFFMVVFFPHQAGLLDGNDTRHESLGVFASAAVLFVIAICAAFSWRAVAKKSVSFVGFCVAAFSIYAFFIVAPVDNLVPKSASSKTLRSFDEAGTDENVFVFMVDMLQGSILQSAMSADAGLEREFDGFLFFARAMSSFPATGFSLPNIMSGKFYNESYKTFAEVNAAARRDSFVEDARARGCEISTLAYSRTMPLSSHSDENLSPELYLGIDDDRRATLVYGHFLIASLVRNSKVPVAYVQEAVSFFLGGVPLVELGTLTQQKIRSRDTLQRWSSRLSLGPAKKLFFQHHIMAHAPVLFGKDGSIHENTTTSLESVSGEYVYTMQGVAASLERMRALGVYDKSLVIITGDHGHYLSASATARDDFPFDAAYKGENWQAAGMYNAAVLVKPPNSRGRVSYVESSFSLSDVRSVVSCYLKELQACDRASVMAIANGRRSNTVYLSSSASVRNYWFSDQHEPIQVEGNIAALPMALKQWNPARNR
ncbi:hypothetical protein ACFLEY_05325 [Bradyrhizobium sp. YCK136]